MLNGDFDTKIEVFEDGNIIQETSQNCNILEKLISVTHTVAVSNKQNNGL